MNINIEWREPIQLTQFKRIIVDENALPEEIEDRVGVYFFSRKFGGKYLPFYVGETATLRTRLKTHLGTKKVADALRGIENRGKEIKGGERYFHYGYFIAKPGQNPKKCIQIVQKYLVREALAANIPLLNIKLAAFKTNKIIFLGTKKSLAIYHKTATVES